MSRIVIFFILVLPVFLNGCSGSDKAAASAMQMRVYPVPAEQTQALKYALQDVFSAGTKRLGTVSSPAAGRIVVLAPSSLQDSIAKTLRTLAEDSPARTQPAPAKPGAALRLSFWSVDAVPGSATDDPALTAITPALDEVRKQIGAVHFTLRDRVGGVSSLDQQVRHSWQSANLGGSSAKLELDYTLRQTPDGVALTLTFADQVPVRVTKNGKESVFYNSVGMNTTTAIRLGQTLVLTQNPVSEASKPTAVQQRLTRLYLVRVDTVPAA
jgi:hypothetical protein